MKNKGMFSLEYAALIVVLVAALVAISVYLQRTICGKFRDSAGIFGAGRQYAPKK